jgi:fibronectin-binding autotransporter adhesin
MFTKGPGGKILVIAALALLGFSPLMVLTPAAHAATVISITTANGFSVCPGSLGGIWSGDTCTISGALTVSSATILDVGAGVTVTADDGSGTSPAGIINLGTITNEGTLTGSSSCSPCDGIFNNGGTINNDGTMTGTTSGNGGSKGSDAIGNFGAINNYGTMTGSSSGTNSAAIGNYLSAVINNAGTLSGSTSVATNNAIVNGNLTSNAAVINNDGTLTGTSAGSHGIYNYGTINDYCGETVSSTPSLGDVAPNAVSCYTVTFDQNGITNLAVTWGVTVSWGPFVLSEYHTGTGGSIALSATGSLTYSYDSSVAGSGTTYDCTSGCSGTPNVSGAVAFLATYTSYVSAPPAPTTGAQVCQGQVSGQCFTSFIAFEVTSGGSPVNANVTITRTHGPTQIGTTVVGGQMAWFDVSIRDTISYTVTLPNGHTVTGTVSNPNPWTLKVVVASG